MKPKLGPIQMEVLRCLVEHKQFYPRDPALIWRTTSQTRKVVEALVSKGLAEHRGGVIVPSQAGFLFYDEHLKGS